MPEIQKEFFDQEREKKKKRHLFPKSDEKQFSFSPSLDTLLLSLVMGVMGVVVIYAVGVEVGQQGIRAPLPKVPKEVSRAAGPVRQPPLPSKREAIGKYTVQVASFTKKEAAERALGKFKKEKGGAEATLVFGSQQIALCVGAYKTRAEADQALVEFRKRYHDAFVRNR